MYLTFFAAHKVSALLVSAIGIFTASAAADPNGSSLWVGGAASLTLLTIAIGFNAGTLVRLRREVREGKDTQRQDQRICNYQLSVLADVLDEHRIPMPGRFWDIPDDAALERHEEERRRRHGMHGKIRPSDENGWVTSIFLGTVVAVLAVFAVFALMLNSLILGPVRQLETKRESDACVASLTADYFVAINRALAAPPAPNHERTLAIYDLNVTAERIRNRVHICADGKPNPYTPADATP